MLLGKDLAVVVALGQHVVRDTRVAPARYEQTVGQFAQLEGSAVGGAVVDGAVVPCVSRPVGAELQDAGVGLAEELLVASVETEDAVDLAGIVPPVEVGPGRGLVATASSYRGVLTHDAFADPGDLVLVELQANAPERGSPGGGLAVDRDLEAVAVENGAVAVVGVVVPEGSQFFRIGRDDESLDQFITHCAFPHISWSVADRKWCYQSLPKKI